jgi:hypothetical protein
MAAAGFSDRVIAQELDVGAPRVRRWVARYVKPGPAGLEGGSIHPIRSLGLLDYLNRVLNELAPGVTLVNASPVNVELSGYPPSRV